MNQTANNGEPLAGIEDVLLLLLKACILTRGSPVIHLLKEDVLKSERFDIMTTRGEDGRVILKLVRGEDPTKSRIIMPTGESPLTIVTRSGQ